MEHSEKRTEVVLAGTGTDANDRTAVSSPKKIISIYAMSFLILATVIVGFIWHDLAADYRDTLAYWNVQLSSSADERVRVSSLWLKERRTDTFAISENPGTIRLLTVGGGRSKDAEMRQGVERHIARVAAINGFLGGAVGDGDCRIAAQAGLRSEMVQGAQEACQLIRETGEYRIDTFGNEQGDVWLNLTAPVMAEGPASPSAAIPRRMVGSAMVVADNWQDFILIFGSESVPTQTTEILVVWQKAGEALIFSPRLRARGVPSFFRRPLAGSSFESRVAREGDVAFGEFKDYRGVLVFGAARRIAAGGDSIVSKVDWDEALSEYRRHRVLDWLAGTLSLLLLGSVMVAQHRHAAARVFAERAKQQEMLLDSEERFRTTFENAGVGMALVDMQGHAFKSNLALQQMLGYSEEELSRISVGEFTHPDDLELDEKLFSELAAGKRNKYEIEKRYLKKGGGVVWGLLTASLVKREHGRPVYGVGMVEDITERKRAEEALRQSEERFRQIAETIEEVFWTADPTISRMLYVSPAYERVWGRSVASLYENPKSFLEAVHADDRERVLAVLELKKTGQAFDHEYRIVVPRGDVRWIWDRGFPIRDEAGQVIRYVGVAVDVTGRKTLEQQLQQAAKIEAIGRLAGGVAHDFNNLLTIINGYSELVLNRLNSDDPMRGHLNEIIKAGDRAVSLTRQLLAFSRQQVLAPRVLDLNDLVADVGKMLHRLIGEDINLVMVQGPVLGHVKADAGQIEQILMNLAVNARDAMPQGGKLIIETANGELDEAYADGHPVVNPGRYVKLAVSDTGIGMDAETKSHIFEPFFTTKEKGKGTGLGLATVYGIVKQSGGYVWVSSEPGRGTTFKIYLPRVEEAGESVQFPEAAGHPIAASETILLVEDEEAVRALAARILQRLGYKVLESTSPEDALRISERHTDPIHLLVTDVVLPRMSGPKIAEHLTFLRPNMKVLYMSGYTDDTIVRSGVLEGTKAFLQKPFTPATLARKVREVLDASREQSS
jgi:PAS domain S-box-containing protein